MFMLSEGPTAPEGDSPKGVAIMASITTTQVRCPERIACCGGKCGGEAVEARYGRKTVEVAACSILRSQGWTGPGLVLWHSQAVEFLIPA